MSAATEVPGGYVFATDNGSVYLQARDGSVKWVASGQFAVSTDGSRLAVMGDISVFAYTLPGLQSLGSYALPGATPGGPTLVAVQGDWVLLFDDDMPNNGPGVSAVWNTRTHATIGFTAAEPFAIGSDGSVLRRTLTTTGHPCYAYTPPAEMRQPADHCGETDRPAGGSDGGALSADGQWAAVSISNRQSPVLVRTADLHAGRWIPVALAAPDGTPIYWDGADVIIGGDQSYRCNTAGRCTRLAVPTDATIVPHAGFPG